VKYWEYAMGMHRTNSLLKYVAIPTVAALFVLIVLSTMHHKNLPMHKIVKEKIVRNIASNDSASESLDTLTADLSKTKQKIVDVSKDNDLLMKQNSELLNQVKAKNNEDSTKLSTELMNLKHQVESLTHKEVTQNSNTLSQPINIVDDLMQTKKNHSVLNLINNANGLMPNDKLVNDKTKHEIIPYYTIPANSTSVHAKLMTALVGRIPVKGVVTDPFPFKIVISDDNLAANGLRIPHLKQMIVSGYCEGDLNLRGVRGWITSLTFVFDDGTISTTTSNDNDIGNFTKSNSLGYLSDEYGFPYIPGILRSNAIEYLAGNVALGASVGAANAFSQSQTTNSSFLGSSTSAVTGSSEKYMAGQAVSTAASEAQKWWHDRQEQSFDVIYVAPSDEIGAYVQVAVNFAKEIHIDYNLKGRKLNYASDYGINSNNQLD
jgi:hypothetical protein